MKADAHRQGAGLACAGTWPKAALHTHYRTDLSQQRGIAPTLDVHGDYIPIAN